MDKGNWTYRKLEEVAEIINGKNQKSVETVNGKYPICGSGGVMGYASEYLCPENTIIIGRKGNINNPIFMKEKFWNVDTAFGIVANDSVNPKFLFYFCKDYDFEKHNVAVTIPSLRKMDLLEISVPIPPLEIQSRIVAELDCISGILEKKRQQLKELDNLAQAIFYDMFGDPVENEKGWEVKKLGEVCLLKAGKAIKANELLLQNNNTYPCYGGNGIRGYLNRFSHTESCPIIGRQGALCGNVNYAEAPFYATEHAVVASPIIKMNSRWLYYELVAMKLNQYAHGVAQPGLAVQDIEPLLIPLPPLSLQQSFAAKIEAIEKQKERISQSIKEVQTLFDSRMEVYFG